jgi:hypothetical protein
MTAAEPGALVAVGVLADFWARDTDSPKEKPLDFAGGGWSAHDIARYASTEHLDDGCVDFWPSVGGQVEVREADGGRVVAVWRGGRKFSPAALAAAEERLAAPAPATPPRRDLVGAAAEAAAAGIDPVAEMSKVIAGFILVERNRGHVVSVTAYRDHALRLGSETAADDAIDQAGIRLGEHDARRDGGGPCGCYPACKIPAGRP